MIREQGDRCVIFDLGDRIDTDTGLKCLNLAHRLRLAKLSGVTDVIPSFISVAIQFEPHPDHQNNPSAYFEQAAQTFLDQPLDQSLVESRIIDIPVCYDTQYGIDLEFVAQTAQCSVADVIRQHTESLSRVFMIGFAPGQPYIGIHGDYLDIPRRQTPRTAVPAGSVAIANRQTTVYPNLLPGGWHVIGMTPTSIFDINRAQPSLFEPGDQVRFIPISSERFNSMKNNKA
jgi:KipI family sensor histidine kinase inhibitor